MSRKISLAYYSGVNCFRDKYHLTSFRVYVWSVSMFASVSRKQVINNEDFSQKADITWLRNHINTQHPVSYSILFSGLYAVFG